MLTFSYKLGFRKFYPFLTDLQRPCRFKEKREMVSLWKIQLPLWSRWFQEIALLVSTSEWLQQPQQRPTSIAFWSHSKLILLVINNFQDIREIRERSIKLQPRLVLVLTGGYSLMCVHICIRVFMYSRVCVCTSLDGELVFFFKNTRHSEIQTIVWFRSLLWTWELLLSSFFLFLSFEWLFR